jgi:hypothetical protein
MKNTMWSITTKPVFKQAGTQLWGRILLAGMVGLLLLSTLALASQTTAPICVIEISTDKPTYQPDERIELRLWVKVSSDPGLPNIRDARLELALKQPFGTVITLSTQNNVSLLRGAEWDEALLSLPVTGEPFRNMGEYQVHVKLLSQTGELYAEAYTTFIIKGSFGRNPQTRTLIVTSRRTQVTEPFVSKLVVWLEAAYETSVQVICQEGLYEAYVGGLYENYDVIIYYATDFEQAPPPALITDIFEGEGITKKKVVWIGYHLEKVGAYLDLYGLAYGELSTQNGQGELLYVDSNTGYALLAPDRISVGVVNTDLVRVRATVGGAPVIVSAKQTYHPEDGECFWFVGFHPTAYLLPFGAHLVFLDILNEAYGIERGKTALVRLEDIDATTNPEQLLSITGFLRDKGVPFTLALIPVYVDGKGTTTRLTQDKDFRITVKKALLNGGELVLHGDTHQYDGVTAIDYEFWDEKAQAFIDGTEYAEQRVADALMEIEFAGLRPYLAGWETPHYAAGEQAYAVFQEYFELMYEDPRWGYDLKLVPYPVERGSNLCVPTNLNYVRTFSEKEDIAAILAKARLLAGLQHGALASFFFHPLLGVQDVETLIQGLREQGWTFTRLSSLARR